VNLIKNAQIIIKAKPQSLEKLFKIAQSGQVSPQVAEDFRIVVGKFGTTIEILLDQLQKLELEPIKVKKIKPKE
jgi:hypothetical protein